MYYFKLVERKHPKYKIVFILLHMIYLRVYIYKIYILRQWVFCEYFLIQSNKKRNLESHLYKPLTCQPN